MRKAWAENAIKKIDDNVERAVVLQRIGLVMYGKGCPIDYDPVLWAHDQLRDIQCKHPKAATFMKYMNENWMDKISMWCTGSRNIPHAGQNTNAAIESYHSNLKSILKSAKERFNGRRMDWLIYHLTGEVVTHYWYGVQCKAFGFIRNRNQEGIVASAIIRADAIPDSNVLICIDDDVAYVGSVNNRPKIWTIHSPNSEWAQCDCPIVAQGMICKHTMKVFKMLHPELEDGTIVRHAGTEHGTHRQILLSQSLANVQTPHDKNIEHVINNSSEVTKVDQVENPVGQANSLDLLSQVSLADRNLRDAASSLEFSQDIQNTLGDKIHKTVMLLYESLVHTAIEYPGLQEHLVADLKHIKGKQKELIARGVATFQKKDNTTLFRACDGDRSLKRHKSFLEGSSRGPSKKPHTYGGE